MTISAVGLFCEDIREEKGGSDILVGVLTDNLNLDIQAPLAGRKGTAGMPKLAMYTRVIVPVDEPIEPFTIFLRRPEGAENSLGVFDAPAIEAAIQEARQRSSPITGFVSKAVMAPFLFPQSGRFEIHVKTATRDIVAGVLTVSVVSSSGLPPPS